MPSSSPSLGRLFVKWEDALDQGRELSPEELAGGRPELLQRLREGIALLKRARSLASPTTFDAPTVVPRAAGAATADDAAAPPGYEILGEVGRGGMGVVYRARQAALNREVALKMILAGGHAGEDERKRFLAEAMAIAEVRHPGIVQVFDCGTHTGLPFFSLELCEGGSLADRLRTGPLPPREAAQMVEKVARAVQAAHEARIVHRDLKPGNVLLMTDGTPRVTDFGLAKKADGGQTQTGAVMGTPSYMAPEQAEARKDVGPPADVYALGAILYECLTGRPPFQAATPLDTIMQVVADDPVPVRRLNATVPADLETICHKCLHKESARRYGSAAGLADDLGRWLRGEPITARPVGRMERMWSWCRREPVTASLVSAITLLLLIGIGVAWGLAAWAIGEKGRADGEASLKETEAGLKQREALAARKAEKEAKANEALAKVRQKEAKQSEEVARKREGEAKLARGDAEREAVAAKKARGDAERLAAEAKAQARRAEEARHAIQIDLALRAREQFDYSRVEQVLAEMRSEYQDAWETRLVRGMWLKEAPFPVRAFYKQPQPPVEVISALDCVAFSPDGKRIACAGGVYGGKPSCLYGWVLVWDALTGKEAIILKGHTDRVISIAYSPDGKRILTGSKDNTARLWDAETGQEKLVFAKHGSEVGALAFSPNSTRIVSGSGGIFGGPGS